MTSRDRRVLSRFLFQAHGIIMDSNIPCTRFHLALGYVAYRMESVALVLDLPDGNITLAVSSAMSELESDIRKLRTEGHANA
jgi:hypothetical protein